MHDVEAPKLPSSMPKPVNLPEPSGGRESWTQPGRSLSEGVTEAGDVYEDDSAALLAGGGGDDDESMPLQESTFVVRLFNETEELRDHQSKSSTHVQDFEPWTKPCPHLRANESSVRAALRGNQSTSTR